MSTAPAGPGRPLSCRAEWLALPVGWLGPRWQPAGTRLQAGAQDSKDGPVRVSTHSRTCRLHAGHLFQPRPPTCVPHGLWRCRHCCCKLGACRGGGAFGCGVRRRLLAHLSEESGGAEGAGCCAAVQRGVAVRVRLDACRSGWLVRPWPWTCLERLRGMLAFRPRSACARRPGSCKAALL